MASIGHVAVGMAAARICRLGQVRRRPSLGAVGLWSALSTPAGRRRNRIRPGGPIWRRVGPSSGRPIHSPSRSRWDWPSDLRHGWRGRAGPCHRATQNRRTRAGRAHRSRTIAPRGAHRSHRQRRAGEPRAPRHPDGRRSWMRAALAVRSDQGTSRPGIRFRWRRSVGPSCRSTASASR